MQVQFRIKNAPTKMGQSIQMVGNIPGLAAWKPNAAAPMKTDKKLYPKWHTKQLITVNSMQEAKCIEYKYIK